MDLIELLGEELFNQVQEKLKEAEGDIKLLVNDGSYIPREKLNEKTTKVELLEGQLEDVKTQLTERDTQLEQLKNDTQASEELKGRITELEEQNKKQKEESETKINQQNEEFQSKLEEQKFNSAIDLALINAKAKNPKAVKPLLNLEKIKLDGDSLLGFKDQIEALKESDSYLFGEDNLSGKKPGDGNPPLPDDTKKNPWSKEHFNLTEQGRMLKKDPELAKRLQAQAT